MQKKNQGGRVSANIDVKAASVLCKLKKHNKLLKKYWKKWRGALTASIHNPDYLL